MTIARIAWLAALAAATGATQEASMPAKTQADSTAIVAHIRSIFEAYLRKDRATIRRTHAEDWVGFLGPSTKIERGIGDYMAGAERSLEHFDGLGYELLDTEVQLHGDLALVYYTARYEYEDKEGHRGVLPLRSLDVYRREGGDWIQAGSHITPIPGGGAWGEGDSAGPVPRELPAAERARLLEDRQAVWRAWFAGDRGKLGEALPPELIAVNAGMADWADRDKTLRTSAEFAAGGGRLLRLEFPRTEILAYGDVAILFTTYELELEKAGERIASSGRGTEVFVRRKDRWVNSAWHLDSGD